MVRNTICTETLVYMFINKNKGVGNATSLLEFRTPESNLSVGVSPIRRCVLGLVRGKVRGLDKGR